MREWDCGSFEAGEGRFWNRITVREVDGGFQVIQVCYDRDAGMRKTETIIETHTDLETAKSRGWQITKEKRGRCVMEQRHGLGGLGASSPRAPSASG